MKISAGSAKGRRTVSRKIFAGASQKERLRPTSAKVREALFDILRDRVEGAVFLDLYAGTGTVGFESLSRGARKAVFVEPDPFLVDIMRHTVRECGFSERAEIVRGKAEEFLNGAASVGNQFDIIFLDPPYQSAEIEKVLPVVGEEELLKKDGAVVVEHFFKKTLPDRAGSLQLHKHYRYGDTMLTLYRRVSQ